MLPRFSSGRAPPAGLRLAQLPAGGHPHPGLSVRGVPLRRAFTRAWAFIAVRLAVAGALAVGPTRERRITGPSASSAEVLCEGSWGRI